MNLYHRFGQDDVMQNGWRNLTAHWVLTDNGMKANRCQGNMKADSSTYHTQWLFCSETCLATVLIRSIFARELENCTSASTRVQFFQRKIERINTVARHVLLWTRMLSTQTTKSWKMLMNNQLKALSLNRKSYRKFTLSWFSVTCFKHVGLL